MLVLHLKIDPSAFNRAHTRLDRRLRYWKRELPYRTALLYIDAVQQAITSQSFPAAYAAHSPNYKKSNDLFWVKSGKLLDEIMTTPLTTMQNTDNYTSMGFKFSQRAMNIIKWMDEGTVSMPARPLFNVLYSHAESDFRRLTGHTLADLTKQFRG